MTTHITESKTLFPASIFRLDNGLTFIHQEIAATPVVVADVWVRAGATSESDPLFGMAHFLEHMIFKGTASLGPGEFDHNIERMGGVSNAATGHDYTHYYLAIASQHLVDTLPHLGELLLNAAIFEDEFMRERDVVLEEIRSCADDPDAIGFEALLKTVYENHPYGRPILGTKKELMENSPEAMRCFHRRHYQPENMTVVIVGGIERDSAWEIVNQTFKKVKNQDNLSTSNQLAAPKIRHVKRQELILPRIEQARLIMAWNLPGIDELAIANGLEILSVILGQGRTSRLVNDLREEKQLVQGICTNFSVQKDSSLLTITAYLEPEYLDRVENLILEHLHRLQIHGVTEQELKRTQRSLCNDYAFSTETPNQLASLYGYYNTIAKAELSVAYPEQIQSFNAKKLQKVAQNYISLQDYAVTILKPY
ncbi:M16 family metallopeptidase [Cylindrospermopsis raciborskii]|uniref:M16 family metallopeptidase n=1 Tax=Cylindrospermopsis raciborskii TaxID=77022 RepID=UPI000590C017|nr:pitrilysin family protein [Cylindrospermopsis raciborskii]